MAATMTIAMEVAEVANMNKNALYRLAQVLEIEGRSNMTKADLVEAITPYCDPTQKVEIVEAPPVEEEDIYNPYNGYDPIEDYKKHLETVEEEEKEMKNSNTEKLCKMLVGAWVWQSKYQKYNGLHLFYDSKQYPGYKIAGNKRLMRVTGDVIKELFGDKHNNYNTIHEAYIRMAQYGFCSIREKDFTVFINDKQWRKLENQFDKLRTDATAAGCHTMREYILG